MDSNAPGQFLGYAIQFSRALFHLLKAGHGDIVCEIWGEIWGPYQLFQKPGWMSPGFPYLQLDFAI